MFDIKPDLSGGETVLGEYGATVYQVRGTLSSSGSNIRLFLTNQRLILKAGLGPQRTLPIYAICDIREEKIGFYTMVRLEFSNGHLEWMTVQNQPQFIESLKAAQAQAPEIPDVVPQANTAPAATKRLGTLTIVIIAIAACVLVGICLLAVSLGGGWLFLRTH
jgi:hypothetical protein